MAVKVYNHKRYELAATTSTKRAAEFQAALARNKGYRARISKSGSYYDVWVRK